jgi:hypothetical protein
MATLTLAGVQTIACNFENPPMLVTHYGCPPPNCGFLPPAIVIDAGGAGNARPPLPSIPRDSDASASKTGKARDAPADASDANVDAEHPDASGAPIVDGSIEDARADSGKDR